MRGRALGLVVLLVTAGAVPAVAGASNDPPRADAGLDRTVTIGETVYLDGGGSVDPDGEIVAYEWTVRTPTGREIDPGSGPRARFEPTTTGPHVVTLTVTDDDGTTRQDTVYITVTDGTTPGDGTPDGTPNEPDDTPAGPDDGRSEANTRPTGELVGPATVERGTSATFRARLADPDGRIVSFDWSVGDTGRTVTRTFTEPPGTTVTISVTATDDDGATRTVDKRVTVVGGEETNDRPSATIDGPTYLRVGEPGRFHLDATDVDGVVTTHRWTAPIEATGSSLAHTFTESGNYTLRAVVTDDDGARSTATHRVRVVEGTDEPPVASLSGPDTVPRGTDAVYELDATDPDGGPLTVEWLSQDTTRDPELSPGERTGTDTRFATRIVPTKSVGETITVRARVTDDDGNSVVVSTETKVTGVSENDLGPPTPPSIEWHGSSFEPDDGYQTNETDVIRGTYHFSVTVEHNETEDLSLTWRLGNDVRKTQILNDVNGSRRASIGHTFVSETGGRQVRRITVVVTDQEGKTETLKKELFVQTLQRARNLDVRARGDGETARAGGRLPITEQSVVEFAVSSYQPFEVDTGDGHSYTGSGTSGTAVRRVNHRYDAPGEHVAVVTSIEGDKGIRAARVTIDVRRTEYTEYRYTEAVRRTERTTGVDRPPGDDWTRGEVVDSYRRDTGETRRVKRGSHVRLPSGPSVTWVQTGTETETVSETDTRIAVDRPGSAWSLRERRVEQRTETRTRTETIWRERRFSLGEWTLVDTRTDRTTRYTSSTSRPGYDWRRAGDTGRDALVGYDTDWRGSPIGATYTGDSRCTEYAQLPYGQLCTDRVYKHRVPEYDDVYYWRTTNVDTDYKYQRTVIIEVTVWANEWERTTTRTVVYDVYEKRVSVTKWEWTRNRTVAGDTVWALDEPADEEYIDGTLAVFERRCDDEGHFDHRQCE